MVTESGSTRLPTTSGLSMTDAGWSEPAAWIFWWWGRRRGIASDTFDPLCGTPGDPIDRWWRNDLDGADYGWNPLDQNAWYYGQHSRKLNQSVTALVSYSFAFALTFLLLGQLGGCSEIYEMPAGGGEQQQPAEVCSQVANAILSARNPAAVAAAASRSASTAPAAGPSVASDSCS